MDSAFFGSIQITKSGMNSFRMNYIMAEIFSSLNRKSKSLSQVFLSRVDMKKVYEIKMIIFVREKIIVSVKRKVLDNVRIVNNSFHSEPV